MTYRPRALGWHRPLGVAIAISLLLFAGCDGDKAGAGREELPQLAEATPEGWMRGLLPAVHVTFDTLPWLGVAVTPAERPKGGFVEPLGSSGGVEETEQRHGTAPSGATAVEPRIALRLPSATPASRLMGVLSGVAGVAAMDDVWIACRNASDEPGWVRLPILHRAEESTLSWEPLPPGEESPGVRLELLPSPGPLAKLRDRDKKIPEEEVWKRLGRLVPIGVGNGRIVRVWLDPTLPLQQVLASLRKVKATSDASLVVSLAR